MNYYGFQQIIKLPTHRRGGLLDHFYTNIGSESTGITFNTIPTFVMLAFLRMFILKSPVTKAGIPQGKDDTSLSMSYKNLLVSVF
jgi:hypothetical protein